MSKPATELSDFGTGFRKGASLVPFVAGKSAPFVQRLFGATARATAPATSPPTFQAVAASIRGRAASGYNFVAGARSTGTTPGARIYNNFVRPARAVLLPNLGRTGNFARLGATVHLAGTSAGDAHEAYTNVKSDTMAIANRLEALGAPKAYVDMVRQKASLSGIAGAVMSGPKRLKQMGDVMSPYAQGGIQQASDNADAAINQGIRTELAAKVRDTRDTIHMGKSPLSYLNPLGARAMSSVAAYGGNKMEAAAGGAQGMKNDLLEMAERVPGLNARGVAKDLKIPGFESEETRI